MLPLSSSSSSASAPAPGESRPVASSVLFLRLAPPAGDGDSDEPCLRRWLVLVVAAAAAPCDVALAIVGLRRSQGMFAGSVSPRSLRLSAGRCLWRCERKKTRGRVFVKQRAW